MWGARASQWQRQPPTKWAPSPPPPATKPLGEVVDSIVVKTLLTELDAPVIKDAKYIASYNWVDSKSPTILIPGSPPAWTPPAEDIKLERDSGNVFRHVHAAHYAAHPMEAAIRSVRAMKPKFDFQNVDIIGCGSILGDLLRCASSKEMAFKFDLDVLGDTLFMLRKGTSPTELITNLEGYGRIFPERYTTWDEDVRASCSHQRIIYYDFGGVQLHVRTETDGYLRQAATVPRSSSGPASDTSLTEALNAMAVGTSSPATAEKLEIKLQGTEVPQDKIFDIKTRAQYRPYDIAEILPRLWFNQTPNFLIAYHEFGLFDKPKVECVRKDVEQWQSSNSSILARFHALLKRIVDFVLDSADTQVEVFWDGKGPLQISKQVGERKKALPSDLCDLWQE